jgi:hypothetical protein
MRAPRVLGLLPSSVFALYRGGDHIQSYSTQNRPVLVPIEVLANHKLLFFERYGTPRTFVHSKRKYVRSRIMTYDIEIKLSARDFSKI